MRKTQFLIIALLGLIYLTACNSTQTTPLPLETRQEESNLAQRPTPTETASPGLAATKITATLKAATQEPLPTKTATATQEAATQEPPPTGTAMVTQEAATQEPLPTETATAEAATQEPPPTQEATEENDAVENNSALSEAQQKLLASLPSKGLAPPVLNETWLNTETIAWDDLRGQVVIVEFWTYG